MKPEGTERNIREAALSLWGVDCDECRLLPCESSKMVIPIVKEELWPPDMPNDFLIPALKVIYFDSLEIELKPYIDTWKGVFVWLGYNKEHNLLVYMK